MMYSGARILVESLIENGVDTIFGYPGGAVLKIYDELYNFKDRLRHILVSHEQHAAHAADGYARSTGKAGVCIATSGPGATNLVTGIATAFVDSVPIVVITGNVSISLLGKDSFQEVDIAGITMPIVKHNWIVEKTSELSHIIKEAFVVSLSGRPGPVLIDIPKDVIEAVCEYESPRVEEQGKSSSLNDRSKRLIKKTTRITFNEDDIEKAALLINESSRPMVYAGGGVINSGANEQVKKLAELLNAPVALSLMGMGSFPFDHPLCTGLVGMYGTIASNKVIQKSDIIISVGARFSDRVLNSISAKAKIIHIDIDPEEIKKNIYTNAFIIGDLKTVLERLLLKVEAKPLSEWNNEVDKL
ncbi:MAG: acetolactate synthase large subunit, partial [Treponema sp.]|nr:acetolactate synthase large subunit [Treponema sp.]